MSTKLYPLVYSGFRMPTKDYFKLNKLNTIYEKKIQENPLIKYFNKRLSPSKN